jgi:predicted PurR-regulated permease PerM
MSEPSNPTDIRAVTEISLRLGLLFLLIAWCLWILAPFTGVVAWALIIAIATDSPFRALSGWLGGRSGLAATLLVLVALATLIVPAVLLTETLVEGAQRFAGNLSEGSTLVPPPPEAITGWPFVGETVYGFWFLASENLADALAKLRPQLQALSAGLLRAAGSAGIALLQLAASIVIAGILLVRGRMATVTRRFARRLVGERGDELADLTQAVIQSVVQGILGVASIQAVLAGIAFIAVDVPGAGLWALLVLVAAVVQLPVGLVLIPPVLVVFSTASTPVAVMFAIWCVMISLLDNVLKPLLFGRGVDVPMIVIFLGAIGGMLAMGIIGLFLGAVVLALGYELFIGWLGEGADAESSAEA